MVGATVTQKIKYYFLISVILLVTSSVGFFDFGELYQAPIQNSSISTYSQLPIFLEHHGEIKKLHNSSVSETEDVRTYFESQSSRLSKIEKSSQLVSPIFLWRLPRDLSGITDVNDRKQLFIKFLLPLLIQQNIAITQKRSFLQILIEKPISSLSFDEQNWISKETLYYKIFDKNVSKPVVTKEVLQELLNRIDIVPVSLALAQSSLETGWGTSRFSIHGNALFGQWTWKANKGIRPKQRAPRTKHSVRRFNHLAESIMDYAHNLNSSSHYRSFRLKRGTYRKTGYPIEGWAHNLAEELKKYSSNSNHYIPAVKTIIANNQLTDFDNYSLSP